MLRGQFHLLGTLTLIGAILAQPVVAATPGAASRRNSTQTKTASSSAGNGGDVRNAYAATNGSGNSVLQVAGRESVGKQISSRNRDPNRTMALLPSLFGGSNEQGNSPSSNQPKSQRTSSQSRSSQTTQASPRSNGILKDLFGTGRRGSTSNRSSTTTSSAPPVEQKPRDVDWNGIPYHAAKSQVRQSNRAPIRDPRPGESRITTRMAAQATTPRVTSSRVTTPAIPKPPSLAKPSSRRVPQLAAAPSSDSRTTRPQSKSILATPSPVSSSRRSGRRDVPALDPSEIAAATAGPAAEESIIPKFSRRPVRTPIETPSATEKVATTDQGGESTRRPKTTPSASVATNQSDAGEKSGPIETSIGDLPREEMPASSLAAAPTPPAESQKPAEPEILNEQPAPSEPKPQQTPSATVAKKDPPKAPATAPAVTPNAPEPKESNPSPAFVASTPAPQSKVNPSVAERPFVASEQQNRLPNGIGAPQVAESSNPAPSFSPPKQPTFADQNRFARPDNFRRVEQTPSQMPVPPNFGPTNTFAGHRVGPPVSAYQPKAPLKPLGTPLAPATAPIVGSGIAQAPAARAPATQPDYPFSQANERIAQQPSYIPPSYNPPSHNPPTDYRSQQQMIGSTYGQPNYAPAESRTPAVAEPPTGRPYSYANRQPARPQTRPVATPVTSPLRPEMIDNAFRGRPFDEPRTTPRVAMRPEATSRAPSRTAVASELPGLRVTTNGPRSIMIRETQEFEIQVENRGSIDANGLMIRARVPEWAEVKGQSVSRGQVESQTLETSDRLVWSIDSLAAGASERMFVKLKAMRSGIHPLDVDWTLLPQKSVARIEVREPRLDLVIEGPGEVVFGESQTYRIRVLNPGDGIAPNVVFTLSPNSSNPQSQKIGDIPSGKEAQFEVELTAQDLGDLKIHGLVAADLGLTAQAEKTVQVSSAQLEAVLAGPEQQYQDTDAVYGLQLTNSGTTASRNVIAELALPRGTQYRGGIDGARMRDSKLVWQVDSIAPGETLDFEFTCALTSPGRQSFEFAANGSAAGRTNVSLDTMVESIADLVMTLQDPAAPAPVGSEVVYEIVIRNRGSRQATNVRAVAQFSNGIEPRRVEGHTGQVLTGQVLFDTIPSIQPGQEVRIRVIAEAEVGGHHRFRTEIRSGETVLVAEEATQFLPRKTQRVSRHSNQSVIR